MGSLRIDIAPDGEASRAAQALRRLVSDGGAGEPSTPQRRGDRWLLLIENVDGGDAEPLARALATWLTRHPGLTVAVSGPGGNPVDVTAGMSQERLRGLVAGWLRPEQESVRREQERLDDELTAKDAHAAPSEGVTSPGPPFGDDEDDEW